MYITHKKGEIAHLQIQMEAVQRGFIVSKPTTEARYDLILDNGTKLLKTQVKYASDLRNNAVRVDFRRETRNNGNKKTYHRKEIDIILVYIPQVNKIALINPDLFEERQCLHLRIVPPKNNQKKDILYLKDVIW